MNNMSPKNSLFLPITSLIVSLLLFASCIQKQEITGIYARELSLIDSVRKAHDLSPRDTSVSDFFMKEVRYRRFGVSLYRMDDQEHRKYMFGVTKKDDQLTVFPLFDNRLLEEQKLSDSDTNQLDRFLKEVLLLHGQPTLNWYQEYQFLSEKILLPVLDLYEIHQDIAEHALHKLTSDTSKNIRNGIDCKQEFIQTYQYIIAQKKNNAPKFFYRHPRYDSNLIYEMDFANPNGKFKVRYHNTTCF